MLGGTVPHAALIQNLKRRGYCTVLLDYYENPPAKQFADRHFRESTLDLEAVVNVARDVSASVVLSACVDQANATACHVAEKLGLPAPYSYETALKVSQKPIMKAVMAEYGIPTCKYRVIREQSELGILDLQFPLIVKPADSNGSKGVKRAETPSELLAHFRSAKHISRNGEVIVETFCRGEDVSVDCFVQDGKATVLMLRRKYDLPGTSDTVINCFASIVPARVSAVAFEKIRGIADAVTIAFGLQSTPLLIQVMVDREDVSVIELAARIGGGLSYRTILLKIGFDILDATLDVYLNKTPCLTTRPSKDIFLTSNVYAFPGVFDVVVGQRELIRNGVIREFYQHKMRGMTIGTSLASGDRVCSFIVQGDNEELVLEKVRQAISRLTVLDVYGKDLTRRDIYLRKL